MSEHTLDDELTEGTQFYLSSYQNGAEWAAGVCPPTKWKPTWFWCISQDLVYRWKLTGVVEQGAEVETREEAEHQCRYALTVALEKRRP